MEPGYLGDVTHRKRGLRFEKKQWVEFPPRKKKVDFQSWEKPDDFMRYGRRALLGLRADDVKAVSIERLCISLSSCRKTFNSKVIKSSWTNFAKFCVFIFPISISHIRILWLCYSYYNVNEIKFEQTFFFFLLDTIWNDEHRGWTRSPPYSSTHSHMHARFISSSVSLNFIQHRDPYTYLPNPSARAGYDTRSIFWAEFNRFEFRVFLLLDELPHQGWRT